MKAVVNGHVIAESDDIVEAHGYQYFPSAAVHREWLEKAPKTESDHECPHGVQFYDVVIDGVRHERAALVVRSPAAFDEEGRRALRVLGRRRGGLRTRHGGRQEG